MSIINRRTFLCSANALGIHQIRQLWVHLLITTAHFVSPSRPLSFCLSSRRSACCKALVMMIQPSLATPVRSMLVSSDTLRRVPLFHTPVCCASAQSD